MARPVGCATDRPSRPDQIFCLYLARPHLSILGALLDVLYELLLLVLKLDTFAIEFTLSLLEGALMFTESLLRGHALSESPFHDLVGRENSVSRVMKPSPAVRDAHIHVVKFRNRRAMEAVLMLVHGKPVDFSID